jgi:hypothetical protein
MDRLCLQHSGKSHQICLKMQSLGLGLGEAQQKAVEVL